MTRMKLMVAAAAALAALAGTQGAFAQTGPGMGPGMGPGDGKMRKHGKMTIPDADERLRRMDAKLGLSDEHFRNALSAALELLGADPLTPLDETAQSDPARARWRLPALDRNAEMTGAAGKIGRMQVGGAHPGGNQRAEQRLERSHRVVDPAQQHALRQQHDARIHQPSQCRARRIRELRHGGPMKSSAIACPPVGPVR